MYIRTSIRFCESQRRFSLFSPLNIYISLFRSLPAPFPSSTAAPGARPSVFLPSCLPSACPPDACCRVFRGCRVSPSVSPSPWLVPCVCLCVCSSRRPSVCRSVCVPRLPLLVHRQAQNSVTVWADAPCICPRPFVLLPMCCRVFRCPFRVLSCGFLPCVRVLLPCVVRW